MKAQHIQIQDTKSGAKRKGHSTQCLYKKTEEISCERLNSKPESSRTKRSEHVQEEDTARNNQTSGLI